MQFFPIFPCYHRITTSTKIQKRKHFNFLEGVKGDSHPLISGDTDENKRSSSFTFYIQRQQIQQIEKTHFQGLTERL